MVNIQYPELRYCDIVTYIVNRVLKGDVNETGQTKANDGI